MSNMIIGATYASPIRAASAESLAERLRARPGRGSDTPKKGGCHHADGGIADAHRRRMDAG